MTTSRPSPPTPATGLFDHVLVGLDNTPESLIAAAQVRCLTGSDGRIDVIASADTRLATHAGLVSSRAQQELLAAAREDLNYAHDIIEPSSARVVTGSLPEVLVAEAVKEQASLVALGAPRHRRMAARLFGGPDLPVVRDLPCSVLVARAGWGACKPHRVLVGVDGSPEARAAEVMARELATRLDCELTPLIALGGDPVDHALLHAERADALLDPRSPIDALTGASEDCLVIVGTGSRAGRVTRHVAHEARCSVLVVRHVSPESS